MMEFTAENVIAAVHEFYRTSEKVNPECHEWLRSCQSSREAWNIVWPLLQPSQTVNVQFTASNILLNKVTRNLSEIQLEDYGGLKDNIVAAVARFVNGPAVVLTRLELTVSTKEFLILSLPYKHKCNRFGLDFFLARSIYSQHNRRDMAKSSRRSWHGIPAAKLSRCS